MALSLNSAAPRTVTKPKTPVARALDAPYIPPNSGYGMLNPGTTNPAYPGSGSTQAAAPAAPASPAPVDYNALLASDPILGQTLAGYNSQGVQNQAQLTAQQQRALIQFGKVPSINLSAYGASIDPTTAQLADQNTAAGTSTVANLQRAYQQAQQGSDASLAARGILHSGAYGQHAAENLQGYNQAGYQANQQLMDYLQGIYSGYLQQQQNLQSQGAQATNDALTRLIQQIQAGQITGGVPAAAPPPPPPPASISTESSPYSWGSGGKQ
jgi:hypothetical protein